jgi:Zn-dependent protease
VLIVAFTLNVALAVLNLLPIPPLDGYTFLESLFRRQYGNVFAWIDSKRQVILLVFVLIVLLTGVLRTIYTPVARFILTLPPFPVGA